MIFSRNFLQKFAHQSPKRFGWLWALSAGIVPFISMYAALTHCFLSPFPSELSGLAWHIALLLLPVLMFVAANETMSRVERHNKEITWDIVQKQSAGVSLLTPILSSSVKKWRRMAVHSPVVATVYGLDIHIKINQTDHKIVDLQIFERGVFLLNLTLTKDTDQLMFVANDAVFVEDTGDQVVFRADLFKSHIDSLVKSIPWLIGTPHAEAPPAHAAGTVAALPPTDTQGVPLVPAAPPTTVGVAGPLPALQQEAQNTQDLAPWFVALADQIDAACADLLVVLPSTPAHSPARHTLEDFLLPRLHALLPAARAFAQQKDTGDEPALLALQDSLGRLVAGFVRCAAALRQDTLLHLAGDAATAAQVFEISSPVPVPA